MGLFSKKTTTYLPPFQKLPELTFYVAGKEYWLGMSVTSSGLRFEREKDAHRKLKGNKNTLFPVVWMLDAYGNRFYVGFVNRGIEPIEYRDAEIAFISIVFEGNVDPIQAEFFKNIKSGYSLEKIQNIFACNSQFTSEEADDCCIIFKNDASDLSFTVDESGQLWEVQYNLYK